MVEALFLQQGLQRIGGGRIDRADIVVLSSVAKSFPPVDTRLQFLRNLGGTKGGN